MSREDHLDAARSYVADLIDGGNVGPQDTHEAIFGWLDGAGCPTDVAHQVTQEVLVSRQKT